MRESAGKLNEELLARKVLIERRKEAHEREREEAEREEEAKRRAEQVRVLLSFSFFCCGRCVLVSGDVLHEREEAEREEEAKRRAEQVRVLLSFGRVISVGSVVGHAKWGAGYALDS